MKQLTISVVVPAYNEASCIERCLQSLQRQSRTADEVIIVDNNSTDDTAAIAQQYGRVIRETNQGIGPARTRGFDEAAGDIIIRIDADTVAAPDLLEIYEAAFLHDDRLVAAAGRPLSQDVLRKNNLWRFVGYVPTIFAWLDRKAIKRITVLYGFNFALRATTWRAARERIVDRNSALNEDIEVSYIIHQFGKVQYISEAKAYFMLDDMTISKLLRYLSADARSMWRYRGQLKRR